MPRTSSRLAAHVQPFAFQSEFKEHPRFGVMCEILGPHKLSKLSPAFYRAFLPTLDTQCIGNLNIDRLKTKIEGMRFEKNTYMCWAEGKYVSQESKIPYVYGKSLRRRKTKRKPRFQTIKKDILAQQGTNVFCGFCLFRHDQKRRSVYIEYLCSHMKNGSRLLGTVERFARTKLGCGLSTLSSVDNQVFYYRGKGYHHAKNACTDKKAVFNGDDTSGDTYFMTKCLKMSTTIPLFVDQTDNTFFKNDVDIGWRPDGKYY